MVEALSGFLWASYVATRNAYNGWRFESSLVRYEFHVSARLAGYEFHPWPVMNVMVLDSLARYEFHVSILSMNFNPNLLFLWGSKRTPPSFEKGYQNLVGSVWTRGETGNVASKKVNSQWYGSYCCWCDIPSSRRIRRRLTWPRFCNPDEDEDDEDEVRIRMMTGSVDYISSVTLDWQREPCSLSAGA